MDVGSRRQIDLHLGRSSTDHGEHRHTGSYGLVLLEDSLLDSTGEGRIEFGIGQLILMMFVFGRDLLEAVSRLVVGIRRGGSLLLKCHDTLCLSLHLQVLRLSGIELHLVVGWVQLGQQLSRLDRLALIHIDTGQRATHLER